MAHFIAGTKSILHRLAVAGIFLRATAEAVTENGVAALHYGASNYDWE
ncbi:MAG: hypothetical protein JO316_19465 [Abitibacteriaceae bacterium]|nr:hypothetical protein [Abditibacteriaceae bacterium]